MQQENSSIVGEHHQGYNTDFQENNIEADEELQYKDRKAHKEKSKLCITIIYSIAIISVLIPCIAGHILFGLYLADSQLSLRCSYEPNSNSSWLAYSLGINVYNSTMVVATVYVENANKLLNQLSMDYRASSAMIRNISETVGSNFFSFQAAVATQPLSSSLLANEVESYDGFCTIGKGALQYLVKANSSSWVLPIQHPSRLQWDSYRYLSGQSIIAISTQRFYIISASCIAGAMMVGLAFLALGYLGSLNLHKFIRVLLLGVDRIGTILCTFSIIAFCIVVPATFYLISRTLVRNLYSHKSATHQALFWLAFYTQVMMPSITSSSIIYFFCNIVKNMTHRTTLLVDVGYSCFFILLLIVNNAIFSSYTYFYLPFSEELSTLVEHRFIFIIVSSIMLLFVSTAAYALLSPTLIRTTKSTQKLRIWFAATLLCAILTLYFLFLPIWNYFYFRIKLADFWLLLSFFKLVNAFPQLVYVALVFMVTIVISVLLSIDSMVAGTSAEVEKCEYQKRGSYVMIKEGKEWSFKGGFYISAMKAVLVSVIEKSMITASSTMGITSLLPTFVQGGIFAYNFGCILLLAPITRLKLRINASSKRLLHRCFPSLQDTQAATITTEEGAMTSWKKDKYNQWFISAVTQCVIAGASYLTFEFITLRHGITLSFTALASLSMTVSSILVAHFLLFCILSTQLENLPDPSLVRFLRKFTEMCCGCCVKRYKKIETFALQKNESKNNNVVRSRAFMVFWGTLLIGWIASIYLIESIEHNPFDVVTKV